MPAPSLKFLPLLALAGICGCHSPRSETVTPERAARATAGKQSFDSVTRNNALALLEELVNDEKHLSLILIIKRESPELKQLVKKISETTGNDAKLLQALLKAHPELQLPGNGLPPGEKATRAAISKTKEHELLHSKGPEFELQLLLTQTEALSYGAHLAQVAADNEPEPERAREFSNLGAEFKQLYEEAVAMLRK